MSSNTFHTDLAKGHAIEQEVLSVVKERYEEAYVQEGYFKEWDIFIPELGVGVEVKSDVKSKYTNNIVIEIRFNGKPSALSTTKAKYWVIYDGYGYNLFEADGIRRCIKENNLKLYNFIGKGDTKAKDAYLIKKDILYKYRISYRERPPELFYNGQQ